VFIGVFCLFLGVFVFFCGLECVEEAASNTMKRHDRVWRVLAHAIAFAVFLGIYLPRAGHGFIADDFEWALHNRSRSAADVAAILTRDNGFYRPVVGLTFAANEFFSGANPRSYGVTNVALAGLCALSVFWLGRELRLPGSAGVLASAVWLLNLHGINMAVLWVSGRTALLLTLAATATVASLLRGWTVPACAFLAVALLSKEEAVLLPAMGALWLYVLRRDRQGQLIRWGVASAFVTALYLVLRSTTGAMSPFNAPWYYRFTFAPLTVVRNALEYADRAFTFSVLIMLLAFGLLRAFPRRPLSRHLKAVLAACAVWAIGGFAITLFLPVRSSLYVCLPSVAAALASAACITQAWEAADERRRRHALIAAMVVPLALLPVHVVRSARWTSIAELSTRTLSDLTTLTAGLPEGSEIMLHDEPTTHANHANLASAYGSLLNDGFFFATGRRFSFRIEPFHQGPAIDAPPTCGSCAAEARLIDGRLIRSR
jgi:hypothetical protein